MLGGIRQIDQPLKRGAALQGKSRELREIVRPIDSIAFRANILALNASVGANKTGDAGRGFAAGAQEARSVRPRREMAHGERVDSRVAPPYAMPRTVCRGWYRGRDMSADSQIIIPPSFIALFVPPGRSKPTETREHIAMRYELCEDLAQMLMEPAQTQRFALGITERDVLERMHGGLIGDAAVVGVDEARWVVSRLAELLGWPQIF